MLAPAAPPRVRAATDAAHSNKGETKMAITSSKTFVVKKVKPGRKESDKPFYMEVGRLLIRETEKGVSGSLYLHFLDGDFAVFPAEKREDKADTA